MNTKRIIFWLSFVVVIGLILWGLVVAMNKQVNSGSLGTPAPISAADHVQGPDTAPVTILEYSDFQCPACENYNPVISKLMAESSSTVRLVYRHFPLDGLLADGTVQHPNADAAAIASEAASVQGNFWGMHDLLFQNHIDWTELKDPNPVFIGYAKQLGLDVPRFTTDLASTTLKDVVIAMQAEGQSIGIDHTPTFLINGKYIETPSTYVELKKLVDSYASTTTQ